jgi:hypothetical protein
MAKENIYEFTVNTFEKKQVETKRKNKEGEEETVTTEKKVKVPKKIAVQKPTRRIAEEAELFYSIKLSKAIKMGIVTKAMLVKKYADSGGALSEEESKDLLKGMKELYDLEEEYKFLNATKKEEEKEKINEVMERIQVLRRDLVNLETSLQSVYQHTADAKAERETLAWYVINLSKIIDENGKAKSYFNGIDYDEQLEDFYDKFESENKAERETAEKLTKIVNFWFYSQSSTKKDIDAFLKQDAN